MSMDFLPIWAIFFGTIILVIISIEGGYLLGRAVHRSSDQEKESPASAIVGSVLGLSAFMLAFAFSIVTSRFDLRKSLVQEEAVAIQTVYLRADFLPESDRIVARELLRKYLDGRIYVALADDIKELPKAISDAIQIQTSLWEMAAINARKDMNSDVAALYIDSLNELMRIHALRVAIGVQARIPAGVWLILFALVLLGMVGLGYQTGIAGSKRSMARPILALSFAMVITLIAALDHPGRGFITVPQQPLIDIQSFIAKYTGK